MSYEHTSHPLSALPLGKQAQIVGILPCAMRQRLLDLGLVQGASIRYLYCSPWGDPMAYALEDMTLALRASEAEKIQIKIVT